jgi:hypothetical protein
VGLAVIGAAGLEFVVHLACILRRDYHRDVLLPDVRVSSGFDFDDSAEMVLTGCKFLEASAVWLCEQLLDALLEQLLFPQCKTVCKQANLHDVC